MTTTSTASPYTFAFTNLALYGLLASANTWSAANTFNASSFQLYNSGTGNVTINAPATNVAAYTLVLPLSSTNPASAGTWALTTTSTASPYQFSWTNLVTSLSSYMLLAGTNTVSAANTFSGTNTFTSAATVTLNSPLQINGGGVANALIAGPATNSTAYTLTLPLGATNPSLAGTYLLSTTGTVSPYQLTWTNLGTSLSAYMLLAGTNTVSAANTFSGANTFTAASTATFNSGIQINGGGVANTIITGPATNATAYSIVLPLGTTNPSVAGTWSLTTTGTTSPYQLSWTSLSATYMLLAGTNTNSATNTWSGTNTFNNGKFVLAGTGTFNVTLTASSSATAAYTLTLPTAQNTNTLGVMGFTTAGVGSWQNLGNYMQLTGVQANTAVNSWQGINTFTVPIQLNGGGATNVSLAGPATNTLPYTLTFPSDATNPSSSGTWALTTTGTSTPYQLSWTNFNLYLTTSTAATTYAALASANTFSVAGNTFKTNLGIVGSTSGTTTIAGAATITSYSLTLPAAVSSYASSLGVLTSTTGGVLSWTDLGTYLLSATAASTYLTQANAATTYAALASANTFSVAGNTFKTNLGIVGSTSGTTTIAGAATITSYSLTLPAAVSSYASGLGVLTSTTGGVLSWADLGTYLLSATAASTYLTTTLAASTYLTQTNAASTYLTQANAATTYAALASANVFSVAGNTFKTNLGLVGSTSGTLTLTPAAVTTSYSLTLPAAQNTFTSGFLSYTTGGVGSWTNLALYAPLAGTNTWTGTNKFNQSAFSLNNTAGTFATTLNANPSLTANQALTLPAALPTGPGFLISSSTGVFSFTLTSTVPTLASANTFTGQNVFGTATNPVVINNLSTSATSDTVVAISSGGNVTNTGIAVNNVPTLSATTNTFANNVVVSGNLTPATTTVAFGAPVVFQNSTGTSNFRMICQTVSTVDKLLIQQFVSGTWQTIMAMSYP
jgi:hypothetical protein